ncbi:Putative lumazine-binding [Kandleria vitulina]|uniref:nuclear transport factor 2 family protein n=1 Tax=Kandleria vitulina TaxID=1630 RepID=UPI00088A943A|nr:nuclear transport factor 2 family protein [Kandleria vitulina]SDL41305.1 Putative lumazine-binding [Kandleria vitulina]
MNRTTIKDYEEILATMQKYIDGCNEGKSEIMKPAFDEGAVMYSVNPDGTVRCRQGWQLSYGRNRFSRNDSYRSCRN